MKRIIENIIWNIKHKSKILWLIVKNRPFFKCPICEGEGGNQDCFGEWSECACYDYWDKIDDYSMGNSWFVGRLPLLQYIIAKDTECAHFVGYKFRYYLACKLGFHDIHYDDEMYGPNGGSCRCCYAFLKMEKK